MSAVVLLALGFVLVAPAALALAGEACSCDDTMCVHRGGADHRHGHQHGSSTAGAAAASHCAPAAAPDCTMRGCGHTEEEALLTLALASLPRPATMSAPGLSFAPPAAATHRVLDRPTRLDLPPPRAFLG